jgi:hypothetical protein
MSKKTSQVAGPLRIQFGSFFPKIKINHEIAGSEALLWV